VKAEQLFKDSDLFWIRIEVALIGNEYGGQVEAERVVVFLQFRPRRSQEHFLLRQAFENCRYLLKALGVGDVNNE